MIALLQNTTFSLADVAFACSLFTSIAAVIALISSGNAKKRKPNELQDQRIAEHEKRLEKIEARLDKDQNSIERLSQEVHLMLKADRALLEHGINGNNIEPMIKSQEEIDEYLIRK